MGERNFSADQYPFNEFFDAEGNEKEAFRWRPPSPNNRCGFCLYWRRNFGEDFDSGECRKGPPPICRRPEKIEYLREGAWLSTQASDYCFSFKTHPDVLLIDSVINFIRTAQDFIQFLHTPPTPKASHE